MYTYIADINECDTDNGGCSQVCTENDGSFVCSCNKGYELDADGTTCNGKAISCQCFNCIYVYGKAYYDLYTYIADINECDTDNGGCSQVCTNNDESFVCSCNTGYELDADGTTCNGKAISCQCFNCIYVYGKAYYNLYTLQILMNVTLIMEDAVRFAPKMMDHLSVHVTKAMS